MKVKFKAVRKQASKQHEAIVNDEPRLHATFDVPSVAHQGDIIFVALEDLPPSARHRKNRQLAEGATQGSRHVCERGEVYDCRPEDVAARIERLYKIDIDPRYVGPVFVSPSDPTEDDVIHPEHGNQGFPAGTVCAVVYQRSLDAEDREARVAD